MRKKNMATRLEKIRDMFIEKGFPGKDVEIIIREIEIGVTRDIIEESRRGYDLLVVGKTGVRCVTGTGDARARDRPTRPHGAALGRRRDAGQGDHPVLRCRPYAGGHAHAR